MKVYNRKFNREYQKLESFEAGIVLTGAEVKSVRSEKIRIDDSFVKILGSEAYLINAEIQVYEHARPQGYDSRRTRKLLLHKKELLPKGWITLSTVMGSMFFFLFSLLSVISEYIIRIMDESRDEPFYFISEEINKSSILPKKNTLNVI